MTEPQIAALREAKSLCRSVAKSKDLTSAQGYALLRALDAIDEVIRLEKQ